MPTNRSSWLYVDLSPKMDITAEIADADVVITTYPVPVAGTIQAVWVCADVLPTTATLAVQKAVGTVDTTVLNAATIALQTVLTANISLSTTLATTAASLRVAAGDMLRAVWTFTTIASGEGFGCVVVIEPDLW